jgi:hypothetical protein
MRAELEAARDRLELPRLADLGKTAAAPELDLATQQRLRELGYVQ